MESFLQDILSVFPLLGLKVFEKTETIKKPAELLTIEYESKGIKASGYEDAKGFVVVKSSQAVRAASPAMHEYLSTLRQDLLAQGVLVDEGQYFVFTQDHVFGSPSTAAGLILGRSANGRIEWKNSAGKTLKEIQTAAAEQDDDSGAQNEA